METKTQYPEALKVRKDWNPRLELGDISELVESMKVNGFWKSKPITVNAANQIIDGHRRAAAALQAGIDMVETIVSTAADETQELIEALGSHGKGLTYREIAKACERLPNSWSAQKIADATGFHKQTIIRARKLATAPDELTKLVEAELVSETAALAWTRLDEKIKDLFPVKDLAGMSSGDVKKRAKEIGKHENASADPGNPFPKDETHGTVSRPTRQALMDDIGAILWAAPDAGFDLDKPETPDYARVSALAYAAGFIDNPQGNLTDSEFQALKLATKSNN